MKDNNSMMPEGNAIIYCEGSFTNTYGKTAHGLIRFTKRYRVISVVDSTCSGKDAGELLDGQYKNIPIFSSITDAFNSARNSEYPATHLVVGIAPDGGCLENQPRKDILTAIGLGLNVDSGLHQFLSEDPEINQIALKNNVQLRDIRKPLPREKLHFFSGKIEEVTALKIAILGTDSAVGKRTTAWQLIHGFEAAGYRAEMIGTGQTAWMQGAKYSIIFDSLINDYVSGEIEHVVWRAWKESQANIIVIEGQGSLMNPAYPGGYEILAAGRPDIIILQHAPQRKDYDGFPGYPIHPLGKQIEAVEMLSGKPVIAIAINHENIPTEKTTLVCDALSQVLGLPVVDVLRNGTAKLIEAIKPYLEKN